MPAAARLGDKAQIQADAHGCPACPHPGVGPIVVGSHNVFTNDKPQAGQDSSRRSEEELKKDQQQSQQQQPQQPQDDDEG